MSRKGRQQLIWQQRCDPATTPVARERRPREGMRTPVRQQARKKLKFPVDIHANFYTNAPQRT
ncbi:MAG: hypothetical protein F6K48_11040 [Okeania sp. SIO3H1]|uniref:hypothetical protein n=1 Tax=Okeania sp. SIO1I7 TaxID=2607772 RepID=UPI0013C88009|nr:hypothetical protein [Okeania sp. SIO1I7]NEN89399.1 hypothetical protein [Okeania sp. SIO3H1]NET26456.1 hypothetical protein [Okeania sp. SIO1I7]